MGPDIPDVVAALKRARELIEQPGRWTTRVLARDDRGVPVDPTFDTAACFCAVGATLRACQDIGRPVRVLPDGTLEAEANRNQVYRPALNAFSAAINIFERPIGLWPFEAVSTFNDRPETTHADVLAAFDRAIAIVGGPALS